MALTKFWRLDAQTQPPATGRFVALAAGADAPLIGFSLPARLSGAARQEVMLRQVADRLNPTGRDIEIRPANLSATDGNWSRSAIAERASVMKWRDALGPSKPRCIAILPDYLALPTAAGLWVINMQDGQVIVRLGPEDGFSAEPALAALLLAQARTRKNPLWVLKQSPLPPEIEAELDGLDQIKSADDLPKTCMPTILAHGELNVDFGRNPVMESEQATTRLKAAIYPLVLVVIGVAAWVAATGLDSRRDTDLAREIRQATQAAAQRDILGDVPVINLKTQVSRALAQRRAAAATDETALTPLHMLRNIAAEIAQFTATTSALTLGPDPGEITVDLQLDSLKTLDRMVTRLNDRGLTARVLRTTSNLDGKTDTRLVFKGGAQ